MAAARTAVRPLGGELAGWHPVLLAGAVGRDILERAGLVPTDLDEVIVGCGDPVGACGADVARAIVLAAGWPDRIGGQVIDRGETSGMAAVQAAVAAIRSGQVRTVLVVGLGICSVVPPGASALNRNYGAPWGGVAERLAARTQRGRQSHLWPAPRLAEQAAARANIQRAELDAAAEHSRRLRQRAPTSTAIVAVAAQPGTSTTGPGNSSARSSSSNTRSSSSNTRPGNSSADGPVRRGYPVTQDVIRKWGVTANLSPMFDEDGLLTAATFAPPADAVAAVLLQAHTASEPPPEPSTPTAQGAVVGGEAKRTAPDPQPDNPSTPPQHDPEALLQAHTTLSDLPPRTQMTATIMGTGRAAGDPFDPTGNVAEAVTQALTEAGLDPDDLADLANTGELAVLVSEPDMATALLVARSLNLDRAHINPAGGAVATGHAGPAEELRLITDGLAASHTQTTTHGHLLTISAGPTGSAALLISRST